MTSLFDVSAVRLPEHLAPGAIVAVLRGIVPSGFSFMAGRVEAPDSLDFYPSPPWVARNLVSVVVPIAVPARVLDGYVIWEPACGAGHLAGPLAETGATVHASDIADYGWPNWKGPAPRVGSFIGPDALPEPEGGVDWVITNPPFNQSLEFARRALDIARVGVILIVRLAWLEGIERWNFRQQNPLALSFNWAERVAMLRGQWDPSASSATAYAAMVWCKGLPLTGAGLSGELLHTEAPGAARRFTRPGDAERFAGQWRDITGVVWA